MGRWIASWMEYLGESWCRGAILFVFIAFAAAAWAATIGAPLALVGYLLGWSDGGVVALVAVSAAPGVPYFLGRFLPRVIPEVERPPSYRRWRAGRLPHGG